VGVAITKNTYSMISARLKLYYSKVNLYYSKVDSVRSDDTELKALLKLVLSTPTHRVEGIGLTTLKISRRMSTPNVVSS
jgi:hypothetical protein